MAFESRQWVDRVATYPGRRILMNVDDETDIQTVDVSRAPTSVSQTGDRFTASSMNDLESRIEAGFQAALDKLQTTFNIIYPVGSIWQSADPTSPQTLFPSTTWERMPNGKVLLPSATPGQSSGNTNNNKVTITPTGRVSLSGQVLPAKAELSPHTHTYFDKYGWDTTEDFPKDHTGKYSMEFDIHWVNVGSCTNQAHETSYAGGDQPHEHPFGDNGVIYATFAGKATTIDIRQPSITIYAWRRTS